MAEKKDKLTIELEKGLKGGDALKNHTMFAETTQVKMALLTKDMGLYPYFVPSYGQIGPRMQMNGRETIMLGSNNYMGLANNPEMIQAGIEALQKYGTGCTGSRFLNGTLDIHNQLEEKLAKFFNKPAGLCFSTGMQANLGVISGITAKGDHLVSDENNHASIIDGCRLSYGKTHVFKHDDMEDLERVLRGLPEGGNRWVVSDGIFSMEGNLAQIDRIVDLAERYGARVIIDDAHGIGYLGDHGEGSCGHYGVMERVDILTGTFSKSFAAIGGFCVASVEMIHHLQHHARSLIYSASMPPVMVACASKAVDIFYREEGLRKQVLINSNDFRQGVEAIGFRTIPQKTPTPIVPIIIGDAFKMLHFNKALLDAGLYTNPVVPPASPEAMLRTSLMANHTRKDIDDALAILEREGKKIGLI